MRIAYNARLLINQKLEGLGFYMLEVLRQLLLQTSHEFLLVTDREGPLPDLPRAVERVTCFPPARHPVLFVAWFDFAVPKAVAKWGADVFLSAENLSSRRLPCPSIVVIHDLAYLQFPQGVSRTNLAYYRHFMPRIASAATRVLTVSAATRKHVATAFGLPEPSITVAYNGVRPRFSRLTPKQVSTQRAKLTAGHPYFVYVGSVHPRKNVDGLIRGFKAFKQQTGAEHRLVIAGRMAWQTSTTKQALDESPYRKHIVLTDYLEEDELGLVIGAAEALCLVSFFEGFGVPIIEAFACGIPVLTSEVSSLPEVAGPGGLCVDPHDDQAIASGLEKLASSAELRQQLAEAGIEHAKQFTWQATGRVFAQLLDEFEQTGGR